MFIWASPFSQLVPWKTLSNVSSSWVSSPRSCWAVRSSESKWDSHSGLGYEQLNHCFWQQPAFGLVEL